MSFSHKQTHHCYNCHGGGTLRGVCVANKLEISRAIFHLYMRPKTSNSCMNPELLSNHESTVHYRIMNYPSCYLHLFEQA